jgi:hypothetical protein
MIWLSDVVEPVVGLTPERWEGVWAAVLAVVFFVTLAATSRL